MSDPASPDDFLSGTSGYLAGPRAITRARIADLALDLDSWTRRRKLRRAAAGWPPARRILVLAIERQDMPGLLGRARTEIGRSRHAVTFATTPMGSRGKFENINQLLSQHAPAGYDWLILLDDDVHLPPCFLDVFLFLVERFDLSIAQPAHRHYSHAAWSVTRRRRSTIVRETAFVEIGPLVAFHARTFERLLPFPPLRVGWGLDSYWSALARERGWRIGVVDATPIEHALRPVAASYDRSQAIAEARLFLVGRPYVTRGEAAQTLAAYRDW